MSNQKMVPKGIREQEVERGHTKKPPIPYIPVDDKIGNKVKSDACTFKVKIDDKKTVRTSIWTGGNPKGFLIHVIHKMKYLERTKLFEEWASVKNAKERHSKDLKETKEYLKILFEDQKKSSEQVSANTTMARKKTKEGTTNTPVPVEEAKQPNTDDMKKYKDL